jgi:hypothetical protein
MNSQSQTEKYRAKKTAYMALYAVSLLCDRGYFGYEAENVLENLHRLLALIESIPVRKRRGQ